VFLEFDFLVEVLPDENMRVEGGARFRCLPQGFGPSFEEIYSQQVQYKQQVEVLMIRED
jgi:hypothetical protein